MANRTLKENVENLDEQNKRLSAITEEMSHTNFDALSGFLEKTRIVGSMRIKETVTDDEFADNMRDTVFASMATDVSCLFFGCSKLQSIDLTRWNLESVVKANLMFCGCTRLVSIIGEHTQEEVDNGLSVMIGFSQPLDVSKTALELPSLCAIINGVASIDGQYALNFTTEQYNALRDYRDGYYINKAKEKGWIVCHNGYSDETLAEDAAGTIIGHDASGNVVYVKYEDFVKDDFDTAAFTPVAVLVIPRSHCADGKCRGVSLRYMSYTTPEEGGNNAVQGMYWGVYGKDETGLRNFDSATTGNVELGGSLGVTGNPYLPSDIFNDVESVIDTVGGVAQSKYAAMSPYMPSPYGAEGVVNVQHREGSTANNRQCNTDMDGEANTRVIIDVIAGSDYSGVLVSGSGAITNVQNQYPAFVTAYRYQGGGYTDHSWYVPSLGEFSYYQVRLGVIDRSFNAIRTKYGNAAATETTRSSYHWTSTEGNGLCARSVMPSSGYVSSRNKDGSYLVRAFRAF